MKEKLERVVQFLREVRTEGRRVSWASRKQVLAATLVVVLFVLLSALYLGLVDLILAAFVRAVLG